MKTKILFVAVVAFTLAATLSVVSHYFTPLPAILLITVRWIAILALVLYALYKRTLTTWILVAMVIGAAVGHDWPGVALHLRVLSLIFLRLIRTIIAPLLFGTLVSGIAAHSDLKKVGRMGVKAIVYFETVTTFALIIGLAAINLSKAGAGVR
jgi:proton glutamate symport protein